ncbi:relaxase/mobilization nuclease domain-containing protein [Lactococcus hircilactis]|uniref:Relaxase/mobilization nuclease domain-containing protein n=1 Tax=Lactococcus hircilactis TaxID=1494462 RepID=A0A7X2CZU1_9LACT|nr:MULTISPECIES: relaxase/mobilization nuclease domain-containing protein [Lactococcus]MQW38528.1 relaxase/mobilization nuclease domain-containing protein [Lactococcus hircilactis]TRW68974.1 transcription elongation factor GreAB [Lactococcus lactis]
MVYTKHFAIHTIDRLRNSKDYIENAAKTLVEKSEVTGHLENIFPYMMNDEKTFAKQLVSGYMIHNVYEASEEFIATKQLAAKENGEHFVFNPKTKRLEFSLKSLERARNGKQAVLAYHLIQSFSPEDGLSPEEVHELGRKTVMELTGGEYEFVIATHVDKAHLHNHIVFNSTNALTGKQFEWQLPRLRNGKVKDMTYEAFQKISDRIASKAGAKIIETSPKNSHAKYTKWQTENIFKSRIKSRLDFLLEHSLSLDDFKTKAKALNLAVDFSGKWATYRLLDDVQVRNTRGRNLVKSDPERYNLDQVEAHLKKNTGTFSVEDVVNQYEEKIETVKNDFDYQVTIEPWQIDHVTTKGLYINVDFGIAQHGVIFIGAYKTDLLEDGNTNLYLKTNDYFYFMDTAGADNNRYMMGPTLMRQLSLYNGTIPIAKEKVISTINELTEAINFLASHGVTEGGNQLVRLEQQLLEAVQEAKERLKELDQKIRDLNNSAKELIVRNDDGVLEEALEQIRNQINSVKVSHDLLKQKYEDTIGEINKYQQIIHEPTLPRQIN